MVSVVRGPSPIRKGIQVPATTSPERFGWAKYGELSPGFRVIPRWRIGARTFAWQGHNLRLNKDCEHVCATSEALIYTAMFRQIVVNSPTVGALLSDQRRQYLSPVVIEEREMAYARQKHRHAVGDP